MQCSVHDFLKTAHSHLAHLVDSRPRGNKSDGKSEIGISWV